MGSRRDARPVAPVTSLALSPDEVAQALDVSRDHLDRHIAPELAWTYSGRRKFVSVRELERYLAESACRPLAEEVAR